MSLSPEARTQWNAFVASSPWGDVLQCVEWGELKARTGWEPLHLAVRSGDELRATALILKRRIPHTRRCLFYCPRGPVFNPKVPEALEALVEQVRETARAHGAIALKADPAIPVQEKKLLTDLQRAGFVPSRHTGGFGGTQPRAVMKVDITPDEDALLSSFHSKWRYNIRLAMRKGVTVRGDCTAAEMDAFYDLLEITAARDGFRIRSRSYFHDLWETLIVPGLGRLFLAYANDKAVAGAIGFVLGHQCWYVYGASDNEHRHLMPNHLVQWEMMRWAKAQGCSVYDMRGVSPEAEGQALDPHLAGLNRFKRGFGARYVEYVGDLDMVFSRLWYLAFQRMLPTARAMMSRRKVEVKVD